MIVNQEVVGSNPIWTANDRGSAAIASPNHSIAEGDVPTREQMADPEFRRQYHKNRFDNLKGMLVEYLSEHPCVDCGESDPIVLEFDHVEGKTMNVSKMRSQRYKWSVIVKEIAKCEVRCANCHRRTTHNRRGAVAESGLLR